MRREQLRLAFINLHGWGDAEVVPLAPDASFRCYLRLRKNNATAMLMDAPPHENVAAFVTITRHLQRIGVRTPAILGANLDNGFLLLEDLGDQTFARLLGDGAGDGDSEAALYRRAIDVLSHIHQHPHATDIRVPVYNADLVLAEANLLLDWYIPARPGQPVDAQAKKQFAQIWSDILDELPPLKPTLVLRDYHIDNLMLVGDDCAVLDYQDAVIGSRAYDLASLLEDARRDIAPKLRAEMMQRYLEQNADINRDALHQHYLAWATQRHCKVAGIFMRLWLRDRKDGYLAHLPRVMKLLQRHLDTPMLAALRDWLDAHLGDNEKRTPHHNTALHHTTRHNKP